jgi:hypothetical protein
MRSHGDRTTISSTKLKWPTFKVMSGRSLAVAQPGERGRAAAHHHRDDGVEKGRQLDGLHQRAYHLDKRTLRRAVAAERPALPVGGGSAGGNSSASPTASGTPPAYAAARPARTTATRPAGTGPHG